MRIAMVSEHASPLAVLGGADAGGQNVHVAALSGALAARGHSVEVYTRRDAHTLPDVVRLESGVRVVHVPAGPARPIGKDEMLPYMPEFGRRLAERWARGAPDVVHAHFWMSGLAALEARRTCAAPLVQTFHALGSVKRRHQGAADHSPLSRIRAEVRLATEVDTVIATCSDEVRELSALAADRPPVRVVPCGVDADAFHPAGGVDRTVPRRARHRLICVGRLVERKGVATVIRALATLPDTELLVVGGPASSGLAADPEAAALAELAAGTGVADRVHLLGGVPHERLPALFRSADVAVSVPWYEPFGIVPLEAMACGLPVVASAVGGMLDTVADGVSGRLIPPRAPDALAAALRGLLADPDRRAQMGLEGRRRSLQQYRWECVASATESVYTDLPQPVPVGARGRAVG